jgi:chloramphenicol-sensitive protein RarD
LPWIALVLAFTFAFYGLVKKTAPMDAAHSLTLETGVMFAPALVYLTLLQIQGAGAIGSGNLTTDFLLVFTGVVTALPLLLFGLGARLIHLSTIGILQYIAPTFQFLIGVLIYHEPFSQTRLVGFGIIWVALVIFTAEGVLERRKRRRWGEEDERRRTKDG